MVAPDEAGELSRSLVRVPGSGYDRSATPSTCASSLAATIPVPTCATPPTRLSEADTVVAKLGNQPHSAVPKRTQASATIVTSFPAKRARITHLRTSTRVSVSTLEHSILQQENATLKQHISMFQRLFQDQKHLENVVRQLGIKIDTGI